MKALIELERSFIYWSNGNSTDSVRHPRSFWNNGSIGTQVHNRARYRFSKAVVIRNFRVHIDENPLANTLNWRFRIRKNILNTSMEIVYSDGEVGDKVDDEEVAFASGDDISLYLQIFADPCVSEQPICPVVPINSKCLRLRRQLK